MTLVEVQPTSVRPGQGSVISCSRPGCALGPAPDEPVYPKPPVDLRTHRQKLGLPLRTAAEALGLLPSQLSGLERGSLRPADPSDWSRLVDELTAAARLEAP